MSSRKIHCVLDADAGRHLVNVEIGDKSACKWLKSEFDLVCSEYVYTGEIMSAKHRGRYITRELESLYKKSQYQVENLERDERKLLAHWVRTEGNRGERYSAVVCHDLVRRGGASHVIFLTNDFAARRLFLHDFFDNYPIGCLWSTWDFLFYIYVRHGRQRGGVSFESMQDALRDLNAAMPILQEEWQPQGQRRFGNEAEARLHRLRIKRQKLDVLNSAMNAGL